MKRIVCLPGDGIGPEVMHVATDLLSRVSATVGEELACEFHPVGQAAIEATGTPLPAATLDASLGADAVLLAAVGGGSTRQGEPRPEEAVLNLRRSLDTFANLRPVRAVTGGPAILPGGHADGVDMIIVREATAGMYFGKPSGRTTDSPRGAVDTCTYDEHQVARVAHTAFKLARSRGGLVTSVDKANVMATSRLWREVVTEIAAEYPGVRLEHLLVDAAAYELIRKPQRFDVVVTDNLFGDILSDEAGVLAGGLGLLGSATVGEHAPGLFEPIHGSAPDIAGRGIANPIAMVRAVALMLRHAFGFEAESDRLEAATDDVLRKGPWTPDLQPDSGAGTAEVGEAIAACYSRRSEAGSPAPSA